jgi:hypothetical protein
MVVHDEHMARIQESSQPTMRIRKQLYQTKGEPAPPRHPQGLHVRSSRLGQREVDELGITIASILAFSSGSLLFRRIYTASESQLLTYRLQHGDLGKADEDK